MLTVKHLYKSYGNRPIFEDFSLEIAAHQILAIVGPSGGGKTTLLRMLAGLERIDQGELTYEGQPIELATLEKSPLLGFVFQDFQLFPHMTVMENLTLSPVQTGMMDLETAKEKALDLLRNLAVAEQADVYPYSLSGGQKQRVALARAMMINPSIIGYDEPTSALDPELRDQVAELILSNKAQGMTQIVVTHDIVFAERIADKILKVQPKS